MTKKNFYLITCVQTLTTDGVIPSIALPEKIFQNQTILFEINREMELD
jgi:hypothetical protein